MAGFGVAYIALLCRCRALACWLLIWAETTVDLVADMTDVMTWVRARCTGAVGRGVALQEAVEALSM